MIADFPIPKSSTSSVGYGFLTKAGYFVSRVISFDAEADSSSNDSLYYDEIFESFLTYEF